MDAALYKECKRLLDEAGDFDELERIVRPYRDKGDADALYLSTRYSVNEDWEAFEERRQPLRRELAANFHPDAMADLGAYYKFDLANSPEYAEMAEALLSAAPCSAAIWRSRFWRVAWSTANCRGSWTRCGRGPASTPRSSEVCRSTRRF